MIDNPELLIHALFMAMKQVTDIFQCPMLSIILVLTDDLAHSDFTTLVPALCALGEFSNGMGL